MCRALRLSCLMARPRLPIYLCSFFFFALLTLIYSLSNPPRWHLFTPNYWICACIFVILALTSTHQFPSFVFESKHLRLFYFAEFSLLVPLSYSISIAARLCYI